MNKRIIATALITLLFMLVGGFINSSSCIDGTPPDRFWVDKCDWRNNCDMVIAGCSRVYRGFSPSDMNKILPGYRIRNFGFSGLGYSDEYMQAVTMCLDTRSSRKTVLLSIQPLNFCRSTSSSNGFLSTSSMPALNRWLLQKFGGTSHFFRPFDIGEIRCKIQGKKDGYYQTYHKNGWVASYRIPDNPVEYLPNIKANYEEEKISPQIVDLVLKKVSFWTGKGVTVYGVRIPTTKEVMDVENRESGFSEDRFISRFEKAGGIWVPITPDGYRSYDGTHLNKDSARKLSIAVAQVIHKDLQRKSRSD